MATGDSPVALSLRGPYGPYPSKVGFEYQYVVRWKAGTRGRGDGRWKVRWFKTREAAEWFMTCARRSGQPRQRRRKRRLALGTTEIKPLRRDE